MQSRRTRYALHQRQRRATQNTVARSTKASPGPVKAAKPVSQSATRLAGSSAHTRHGTTRLQLQPHWNLLAPSSKNWREADTWSSSTSKDTHLPNWPKSFDARRASFVIWCCWPARPESW